MRQGQLSKIDYLSRVFEKEEKKRGLEGTEMKLNIKRAEHLGARMER